MDCWLKISLTVNKGADTMYTKDEMYILIAEVTGLDLDDVSVIYSNVFGNVERVSINSGNLALLSL